MLFRRPPESFSASNGTQWLVLMLVVLLFGMQPLDEEDFWWHLARGGAVLNGTMFPSYSLLVDEPLAEADWLGGVPFVLLYEFTGLWGIGLFPLCATGFLLWQFLTRLEGMTFWTGVGTVSLLAMIGGNWLQPTPRALDFFWLCLLFNSFPKLELERKDQPGPADFGTSLVILLMWANTGSFAAIGWLAFLLQAGLHKLNRQNALLLAFLSFAITCLTPRHIFTLWDSLHYLAPWLFESPSTLAEFGWNSLWESRWQLAEVLFSFFVLFAVCRAVFARFTLPAFCAVLLAAVIGVQNIALMGLTSLWILLTWYNCDQKYFSDKPARYLQLAPPAVFAILWFAFGPGALTTGIAPRLDIRLLEDGLPVQTFSGTVWCDSDLAAGLYCYARLSDRKCLDTPSRALIGGRLAAITRLKTDLLRNRESRYRRPDGTWGGWWREVEARQIDILLPRLTDDELHLALIPTEWKPTDLDAGAIPYVRASNQNLQQLLIEILQQQDLVSYLPWAFDLQEYRERQLLFPIEMPHARQLIAQSAFDQARFFRTIQRPLAGLKILHHLTYALHDDAVQQEILQCHRSLANRELQEAGALSRFQLELSEIDPKQFPRHFFTTTDNSSILSEGFRLKYYSGDLNAALAMLQNSPEEIYARAMLHLEMSQPDQAVAAFQLLQQTIPEQHAGLRRLATYWLDTMGR